MGLFGQRKVTIAGSAVTIAGCAATIAGCAATITGCAAPITGCAARVRQRDHGVPKGRVPTTGAFDA